MIRWTTGDILTSRAEALVNTVNTVGVMGKGIALQFRELFPHNYKVYVVACRNKELAPGKLLSVWDESQYTGKKLIINFPTKVHWKSPSRYEYIEKGLDALNKFLLEKKIESIAIPPLGCGNGGLDWREVRSLIENKLKELETEIIVYEPNKSIIATIQKRGIPEMDVKLTPARASLLYVLFAFESMGEYSSLFAANKLAYFLQRSGQKLNLDFKPHYYGPYAIGVEKVLYHLNGVYLKGLEQGQAKPFDPLWLNYERWHEVNDFVHNQLDPQSTGRVEDLIRFLSGYTSELSLEILATVDFILSENSAFSLNEVMERIASWNPRKKALFRKEYVKSCYDYLKAYRNEPGQVEYAASIPESRRPESNNFSWRPGIVPDSHNSSSPTQS